MNVNPFLIEKDKANLYKIYNNSNYLKLKKIDDFSSFENALLILIKLENPFDFVNDEKESIIFKEYKIEGDFIQKITFKYEEIGFENNVFLNTFGVISSQSFKICKLPKLGKLLANDFIEKKIITINDYESNSDGFTNINVKFIQMPQENNSVIECVFKVDGIVLCSQLIKNSSTNNFINYPNVLWMNPKTVPKLEIFVRYQESSINESNLKCFVNFDTIYLECNSRKKVMDNEKYLFETANNNIIMSINGKFGIKYYTQFINNLHSEIKFLYDSNNFLSGQTNDISQKTVEDNFKIDI